MFKNARNLARKYGAKIGTAATLATGTVMAHAQATDALTGGIDSVNLGGAAVKVAAAMVLVIGLAMAFKGGDLGKRVVRKV